MVKVYPNSIGSVVIEDPINTGNILSINSDGSINAAIISGTSGGALTYEAQGGTGNALLTSTPIAVKASAGTLEGFVFVNTGVSVAYVQVFDLAVGSVTLGTTAPKTSYWVPAGGAYDYTGTPISFATAITVAATTTATGAVAPATGINANIYYK